MLAIVDGLDEDALRTPVVPSGWTPLGLIEHLGFAERYWFQHVATGSAVDLPWPEEPGEDEDAPFTTAARQRWSSASTVTNVSERMPR